LITEFKGWNILIVDFDTQISSLMNNQILRSKCEPHPHTEIFLPYQVTHKALVDKFIEYDKCNSLIVIDSLNGLLDYFNFYRTDETSNNDKKNVEAFERSARLNHKTAKHAGFKSLNLLKILFDSNANKEIPVIVTSYQSQSSIDRLIFEMISDEAFPYQENNHFRRISNLVALLEYFQDKDDLFITILRKIPGSASNTMPGFLSFPQTWKLTKEPLADSLFDSLRL
jgi:hypothetical protein